MAKYKLKTTPYITIAEAVIREIDECLSVSLSAVKEQDTTPSYAYSDVSRIEKLEERLRKSDKARSDKFAFEVWLVMSNLKRIMYNYKLPRAEVKRIAALEKITRRWDCMGDLVLSS